MVEKQRYIHKKRTFRFQEYIKISNSIIKSRPHKRRMKSKRIQDKIER